MQAMSNYNQHRGNRQLSQRGVLKDTILFTPAEKYYEILQDLIFDMLECNKHRDIYGMVDIFEEIYLLTLPYIEKYMTNKKEKELIDDLSDISNLLKDLKEESTDFITRNNNIILMEAKRMIQQRKRILYKLMAKARLFLPLDKYKKDLPIAMASDDE